MKRLGWITLAALAGVALYGLLFARYESALQWQVSIDRRQAIQRAYETAAQLGIEAGSWTASSSVFDSESGRLFQRRHGNHELARYIHPLQYEVRLDDPDSQDFFEMNLAPNGELRLFRLTRPTPEKSDEGGSIGISADSGGGVDVEVDGSEDSRQEDEEPPAVSPEVRSLARQTLEYLLAGRSSADLELEEPPASRRGGFRFRWTAPEQEGEPGRLEVEVTVGAEEALEGGVGIDFSEDFESLRDDFDSGVELYTAAVGLLATVLFLAGAVFLLLGCLNREIHYRTILSALLLVGVIHLIAYYPSGALDAQYVDGEALWEIVLQQGLGIIFVAGGFLFCVWGPTYMLGIRKRPLPLVSADLFLRGRWLARPLGEALFAGVVLGPALAALPYLAKALMPSAMLTPPNVEGWAGPMLWTGAFDLMEVRGLGWVAFLYGLWYSLMEAFVKHPLIRRSAQVVMAIACLASMPVNAPLTAALLAGGLIAVAADLIYHRLGLLSVVAVFLSAYAVRQGTALLGQPSAHLQEQGMWTLSALGALALSGLLVARLGRPVDLSSEARRRLADSQRLQRQRRAERDKLLAEFSVAQRAQQMMLPENPPHIKGYQLAGICQPAREVGGDLYDFLPLSGGRWVVTVADVAGKGVGAALYMTLTKGLLTSVSEQSSEPFEIVRRVNQHYFASVQRNRFVTLALAALDPQSGRARCARAGHNPVIWRRARRDETVTLNTSGLGLGLVDSHYFDRSLAVEEIELEPGDALFFYSDGIPEAMNRRRQEYGDERLRQRIADTDGMSASASMHHILEDVKRFVSSHPASDDVTLVVLRREERRTGSAQVASQAENLYTEELSEQAG